MQDSIENFIENPGIIQKFLEDKIPVAITFAIQLVVAIIIFLIGIKIVKAIVKAIKKGLDKSKMDGSVVNFLCSIIKYALYFVLIMAILSGFGVATGSIVAILGSAGLAVGLALQGSLANFAGGVLVLILKPFAVGDYIIESATGREGFVDEISLFSTKLKTVDNKVVIIPNGKLADSSITNVSMMPTRRVDVTVNVAYSTDLKQAKEVLLNTAKAQSTILPDETIDVFVSALGESAVELCVRIWVNSADYWTALWSLTEDVKNALDANGITIPFPQLDVSVKNS